jgi:hypothetical protein
MKPHRKGQLFDPDQIALTKGLSILRQTTAAGSGGLGTGNFLFRRQYKIIEQ